MPTTKNKERRLCFPQTTYNDFSTNIFMEKFKLVRDYTKEKKGDGHNTYGKEYKNELYHLFIDYTDDLNKTTYMECFNKKEFRLAGIYIKFVPIDEEFDNYPYIISDGTSKNLPFKYAHFKIAERNTPLSIALFHEIMPEVEMDIDEQEEIKMELISLAKPLIKEVFPEDCTYIGSKEYYKKERERIRKEIKGY